MMKLRRSEKLISDRQSSAASEELITSDSTSQKTTLYRIVLGNEMDLNRFLYSRVDNEIRWSMYLRRIM